MLRREVRLEDGDSLRWEESVWPRRTRQPRADKLRLCELAEQALDVAFDEVGSVEPEGCEAPFAREAEQLASVALPEIAQAAQPVGRHFAPRRRPDGSPLGLLPREEADGLSPDSIGPTPGFRFGLS